MSTADYQRKWYAKNAEHDRARRAQARQDNTPGAQAIRARDRARESPERRAGRRRRYIRAKYGVTVEQYEEMLSRPCAICGRKSEVLDHDHDTGRVRAALCGHCNVGIGRLGDDAARLRAAADYIDRFAEPH